MSRKNPFLMGAILVLVAGTTISVSGPAAAERSCFGEAPTIVATNRDPRTPVEIEGTPGNDVIIGLGGWDIIHGRGGDDLICSGGGDDFIKAGTGNDRVRAEKGFDTIHGGRGQDTIWGGRGSTDSLSGGPGDDRLYGGPGDEDSLIGGPGDDLMDGGAGYDLAEFWDSPRGVEADLGTGQAAGRGHDRIISIEGLVGSRFDDFLYGDGLSNLLIGGEGDDIIRALGSQDGGSDLLRSGGGEDLLDGGDGPDIVSYNLSPLPVEADLSRGEALTLGLGHDTLVDIEHLVGSKYDDTIIGNDEDNLIVGNGGNDVLDGGAGVDEVAFFDSREPVVVDLGAGVADAGEWGSDTLLNFENVSGSAYRDRLLGDDGQNAIWGGSGADSIVGLAGDDVLIGESGNDEANGGEGTDECDAEIQTDCEDADLSSRRSNYPWTWMRGLLQA